MLSTGEIVRVLMDEKGLKVKDLVKITSLREAAILNVIYNRTNRAEYLNRIASALDVPLETLIKSKKGYPINVNSYKKSIMIVIEELQNLNIVTISSERIMEYIESAYYKFLDSKDISSTSIYISGMINGHIKLGFVKEGKDLEESKDQ